MLIDLFFPTPVSTTFCHVTFQSFPEAGVERIDKTPLCELGHVSYLDQWVASKKKKKNEAWNALVQLHSLLLLLSAISMRMTCLGLPARWEPSWPSHSSWSLPDCLIACNPKIEVSPTKTSRTISQVWI